MSIQAILSSPPISQQIADKARTAGRFAASVLNKHTDLISSVAILAITTCLLASKLFDSIPKFLPRLSLVVFNFGGIIWLNVQVRDLMKSCKDLSYSFQKRQWQATVETAAKVFYKGVNIILTCVLFGGSVAAACGMPGAFLAVALATRPLALASLAANICCDVRDYFVNEEVLRRMKEIEASTECTDRIASLMVQFLERLKGETLTQKKTSETLLADRIICQLDTQTLEIFQERLEKKEIHSSPRQTALKIFYAIHDGIRSRQAGTEANLSLMVMGYASMALCKIFPDSLVEMATRWSMSVLYTDELIRQKLFQYDLEGQLA